MKISAFLNCSVLKSIFALGVPVSIQGFLLSSLAFVDAIMVASLSDTMLAAMGVGARWFWFISILLFSCISGAGVLLSQFSEREDLTEYRDIAIVSFLSLAVPSIVIASIFIFYPSIPISAFTVSVDVEINANIYVQCIGVLAPLTATCLFLDCIFRIDKKSITPLIAVVAEVIINITLNYGLIYGHFGLPQLGVVGAGIGSITARIVRIMILCRFLHLTTLVKSFCVLSNIFRVDKRSFRVYYSVAAPVAVSSILWGIGLFVLQLVYASIDENTLAIISLLSPLEVVAMTLVGGIVSGASIVIGKHLGKHEYIQAEIAKKNAIFLSIVIGGIVGLAIVIAGFFIVSVSELSEHVKSDIYTLLPVIILAVAFRSLSSMQMQAILKSGGDVNFCFKVDVICQWLISLPIIVIAVYYWELALVHVLLLALLEDIIKSLISYYRIKEDSWKKTLYTHSQ